MKSKWGGKSSANITSTCPYCFDSEVLSLRRLPTGHAVTLGWVCGECIKCALFDISIAFC